MQIDFFDWDKNNIEHISRHSVVPDEAEEVFGGRFLSYKTREGKYILLGRSDSGRLLTIVFKHYGGKRARVITARDMSDKEKRLYKRRKGNE